MISNKSTVKLFLLMVKIMCLEVIKQGKNKGNLCSDKNFQKTSFCNRHLGNIILDFEHKITCSECYNKLTIDDLKKIKYALDGCCDKYKYLNFLFSKYGRNDMNVELIYITFPKQKIVKFLITEKIGINIKDKHGWSLLHLYCEYTEISRWLVKNGANFFYQNKGLNPYDLSVLYDNPNDVLLQAMNKYKHKLIILSRLLQQKQCGILVNCFIIKNIFEFYSEDKILEIIQEHSMTRPTRTH